MESLIQGEQNMSEASNLPAAVESTPVISNTLGTKCPHCGQEFSAEGIHIAVFLCGIFFLFGKDRGYAGITCPSCLKTIYHSDSLENILDAKEMLAGPIQLGGYEFDPNLRYFSSAAGSPIDIPLIGEFCIAYYRFEVRDNRPVPLSMEIDAYLEENPWIKENCLCSFLADNHDPAGTFCYIWWFKEDEIENLLRIENEKGIKIFPRYYHRCSLIEDVDRFCWKYGLLNKNFDDLKNHVISNRESLEKKLIREGIDYDQVLDQNPDIMTLDHVEFFQSLYQKHNDTAILNLTGDFLDILLADPDPWDSEGQLNRLCKGFWKTKSPFSRTPLPRSFTSLDQRPFEAMYQDDHRSNIVKTIVANLREKYVQDFLFENYGNFVNNYIDHVKTKNFSYAELWALKEHYFNSLNEIVKKETTLKNTNKFYRKDGLWVLSYQGETIRLKDLKGFAYMQFLVSKTNKDYSYTELHNLFGAEGQIDDGEEKTLGYDELRVTDGRSNIRDKGISRKKLLKVIRKREKIKEAITYATEMRNAKRVYRLEAGLSKFDDDYNKLLPKKEGQAKTYEKVADYKGVKDKVDRDIKYALKYLKTIDEKAWRHFRLSIKNRLGRIGYELSDGPGWFTG
jgi:hypothetical protein